MKTFKHTASLLLFTLIAMNAPAQRLLVGPEVGVNVNRVHYVVPGLERTSPFAPGMSFGISALTDLRSRVNVMVDLKYQRVANAIGSFLDYKDATVQNSYLNVPARIVLESTAFGKRENYNLAIYGGPEVSYWMTSRLKYREAHELPLLSAQVPIGEFVKTSERLQFGFQVGVGLYKRTNRGKFGLSARYSSGFSKHVNTISNSSYQNYQDVYGFRNQSLSITTSYYFNIRSFIPSRKKSNQFVNPTKKWNVDL